MNTAVARGSRNVVVYAWARWMVAFCAVFLPLLAACTSSKESELGTKSSATFVCNNAPVFSFDTPLLWTPVSGTISASTRRIQGLGSVRLQGAAHAEFKSAPTCTAPFVPGQIAFSVASTSTTAPPVDTTVVVTFNSLFTTLFGAQVGSRQVTLSANGAFTRIEMPIPASIGAKLALGSIDLGISIGFDGATPKDFLIDDLSITAAPITPVPGTGPLETATISVDYPLNSDITKIALLGQQRVTLSNNAAIVPDCDGLGSLASVGADPTEIGPATLTGPIVSKSNVLLRDLSVIKGDVTTAGTITRGNLVTVTGQLRPGTAVTPLNTLSWSIQYNLGTVAVALAPLQVRALPPGAYTAVSVPAGAKLSLSTGTYYFDSLSVALGGFLSAITDAGPVVVYVKNAVTYAGNIQYWGPRGQLVVVYTGASPIVLRTPFDGFVVAPKSDVRLAAGLKAHAGAVFAKTVLLDPFVLFAPRNTFPILAASARGTEGNKTDCTSALTTSAFAQTATARDLDVAILRYCGGATVGPCELALRAQSRIDFHSAAVQMTQGALAPCKYLTLMLDRERRLRDAHGNETLACSIFNADPDGDFIPTSRDSCANTPSLAAVLDNGCTDPACPNTPPVSEILAGLPEFVAISADPRCKNAPSPKVASPFGAWRYPPNPSVGKALWVSRDPDTSGCPKYYVLEGELTDGSIQTVIFQQEEDVNVPWISRADDILQFSMHNTDPGGRGAWASYSVFTARYRIRVFNAAGRRSEWSYWYRPGQEGCAAGGPCSD